MAAFLVLRQLLDTSRAGEGSVPAEWAEGLRGPAGPPAPLGLLWELRQAGPGGRARAAVHSRVLTLDLEVRGQQPDVGDSNVACVPIIKLHHHRVQVLLLVAGGTCEGGTAGARGRPCRAAPRRKVGGQRAARGAAALQPQPTRTCAAGWARPAFSTLLGRGRQCHGHPTPGWACTMQEQAHLWPSQLGGGPFQESPAGLLPSPLRTHHPSCPALASEVLPRESWRGLQSRPTQPLCLAGGGAPAPGPPCFSWPPGAAWAQACPLHPQVCSTAWAGPLRYSGSPREPGPGASVACLPRTTLPGYRQRDFWLQ